MSNRQCILWHQTQRHPLSHQEIRYVYYPIVITQRSKITVWCRPWARRIVGLRAGVYLNTVPEAIGVTIAKSWNCLIKIDFVPIRKLVSVGIPE